MNALLADLRARLGAGGLLEAAADCAGYATDLSGVPGGPVLAVARPRSTAEVSAALAAAHAAGGVAVIARGGGTGLAGGAAALPGRPTLILSLERMRAIRSVDPVGGAMTLEAGCTLHDARAAAEAAGRLLGLDHGGSSSQIGGNLSTNAGGNNVLRYGMARAQVLGLEVVLADGPVLSRLSPLPKCNTGPDLKQLFLGSEGTLGVITAATLRLRPRPQVRVTACLGLATLDAVLALFGKVQAELGEAVSAFEVLSQAALALDHAARPGSRPPFATPTPWAVLIEADSPSRHFDLTAAFDALMTDALAEGLVADGTIAASEGQRQALWALREGIPAAMIEEGALLCDTAVPIAAIPAFDRAARAAVERLAPGCIPAPFGHVGDGNLHFDVLAPPGMAREAFHALHPQLAHAVAEVALAQGGTISAEHGIGLLKRADLARMLSAEELALMARLKQALDPGGMLNPGKVLPG